VDLFFKSHSFFFNKIYYNLLHSLPQNMTL